MLPVKKTTPTRNRSSSESSAARRDSRRAGASALTWACFATLLCGVASAQGRWASPSAQWDTIGPPRGALLIHGGNDQGGGIKAFLALVGDPDAPIVLIPTAGPDETCGETSAHVRLLKRSGATHVTVLHTRERSVANSPEFVAPLRAARAVWISGGQQSRLAKAYLHTLTHRELFGVLERGGVVGGTSAGASIQGSFLFGGHSAGDVGFDLVRNAAIGQHYIRRQRWDRLVKILTRSPGLLGIGIDEDTFVVVRGNMLEVGGSSKVLIADATRPGWPGDQPFEVLCPGDRYDMKLRQPAEKKTLDPAKQWAGARSPWVDPAAKWKTLGPPQGTLLLSGAKPTPAIMKRFLALAGGPQQRIVVIPTADARRRDESNRDFALLKSLGARNVELWHTIDRDAANSTEFVAPLGRARAVWITGGEQWRLADAYLHTLAHRELFDVLRRGGVVGAAGAGARFLASTMAGDDYGWDQGCGLVRDAAVHTWPARHRRLGDIVAILRRNPSLLGIGIDDQTAIVVRANTLEVTGAGKVALFDATRPGWPWEEDEEPYLLLGDGERFNLKTRRPEW